MYKLIDDFSVPTIGRKRNTSTGLNLLVSVQKLTPSLPYDVVAHIDVDDHSQSIELAEDSKLCVEARDIGDLEHGRVGYCVCSQTVSGMKVLEADVMYTYRGNGIIPMFVELAAGLLRSSTPEQAFRYL